MHPDGKSMHGIVGSHTKTEDRFDCAPDIILRSYAGTGGCQ
jgi:hypothetical protein